MDAQQMAAHCTGKPGAWPDNPWEHEHPVFKVGPGERGKIFAFLGGSGVGVKAGRSREVADEWLHRFPGSASVMAYIGRSGWNDLSFDGIPRRGPARGGRRVLPAGRRGTAEEAPSRGLGPGVIGRTGGSRPERRRRPSRDLEAATHPNRCRTA